MGIFSIMTYGQLSSKSPIMGHLIKVNFLLFIGAVVFLGWMFSPRKWQEIMLAYSLKLPIIGARVHKTFESVWKFSRSSIIWGLLLSMLAQSFGIFAFWLITKPFYLTPIPFVEAFTFIPLGLIAIAIPIAPAGLGVGHAIFDSLFSLFHISKGASLFNLHFLMYVTINLLGVIPYLLSTHKPSDQAMHEFDSAKM
jgi:hypothetical protein